MVVISALWQKFGGVFGSKSTAMVLLSVLRQQLVVLSVVSRQLWWGYLL